MVVVLTGVQYLCCLTCLFEKNTMLSADSPLSVRFLLFLITTALQVSNWCHTWAISYTFMCIMSVLQILIATQKLFQWTVFSFTPRLYCLSKRCRALSSGRVPILPHFSHKVCTLKKKQRNENNQEAYLIELRNKRMLRHFCILLYRNCEITPVPFLFLETCESPLLHWINL